MQFPKVKQNAFRRGRLLSHFNFTHLWFHFRLIIIEIYSSFFIKNIYIVVHYTYDNLLCFSYDQIQYFSSSNITFISKVIGKMDAKRLQEKKWDQWSCDMSMWSFNKLCNFIGCHSNTKKSIGATNHHLDWLWNFFSWIIVDIDYVWFVWVS